MLKKRWLPHEPLSEQTLGEALWLERNYWDNMATAVQAGIVRAFEG